MFNYKALTVLQSTNVDLINFLHILYWKHSTLLLLIAPVKFKFYAAVTIQICVNENMSFT